ncbi:uncharacterized protein LOC113351419 [Papaver somniferum]|uniref:uncharacterized protein LOC113351419 n=1 Tax=Papaver somniferum TaxID=3469 RepID=UPI000E7035D7|nr:uncharacterized protein LOC113351419 [Papaver somniferum]
MVVDGSVGSYFNEGDEDIVIYEATGCAVVVMDSSNASNSNTSNTACGSMLPQSSTQTQNKDPAWKWAKCKDPAFSKKLSCVLCNKEMRGGGITRLKEHITQIRGNVSSCLKASAEVINEIRLADNIKKLKKSHRDDVDAMYRRTKSDEKSDADTDNEDLDVQEVEKVSNVGTASGSQEVVQSQRKRKFKRQSNYRGPIDLLMQTDHHKTQQATLERNSSVKEKLLKDAWKSISAWMTENSISFNTVRCPSFQEMIYAIGEYGKAMPAPSYHQIRTNLFKEQLEEMKKFVDTFRIHWKRYGCSIMSDGWTDGKKRHLINFLVNCPKGSVFLKSVDASDRTNDADFIRELVKEVINDVGKENVVQFITDNGSNFKKAGKDLMLEYPNLFWTPCGAHCVQLMLEELGDKLTRIRTAVILGKRLVTYIYAHFQVLCLMRKMTGGELHRSTKTRFATQYYTLESLQKYKNPLQMMFVNDRWAKSRFAKENVGINALKIVTSSTFWEDVDYSCSVLKPLVKVVRLVDIERKPTMPCFYDAMRIARDQLEKNFSEDYDTWAVINACFEKRWKKNFNHALHCAAYYLNPSIFYNIETYEMDSNEKYIEIKRGLHTSMERLIPNEDELDQATSELRKYADAVGILGSPSFKRRRTKDQPHDWWITFGGIDVPNLQKFAIRVLSLTCSASPCDNVSFNDLQETVGEERETVGSGGACSSRSKSTFPTDSEYDGYDTDELMLDTEKGLLVAENDGVTQEDDIYDYSNYVD